MSKKKPEWNPIQYARKVISRIKDPSQKFSISNGLIKYYFQVGDVQRAKASFKVLLEEIRDVHPASTKAKSLFFDVFFLANEIDMPLEQLKFLMNLRVSPKNLNKGLRKEVIFITKLLGDMQFWAMRIRRLILLLKKQKGALLLNS